MVTWIVVVVVARAGSPPYSSTSSRSNSKILRHQWDCSEGLLLWRGCV